MAAHFCVLASGSSGNASVLSCGGFSLLVDVGLGPRLLGWRLAAIGSSLERVHGAILTHVHGDHWNDRTFVQFARRNVIVYCHELHAEFLCSASRAFRELRSAGLVRHYHPKEEIHFAPGFQAVPLPVKHDSHATCGFRFEGDGWSIGYATDLGTWHPELAESLRNVDVLAIEFNHDVQMQLKSERSERLINRVLGDYGHLSNEQASRLVESVLQGSDADRLQHVIQLHLSRECNRPELAREAAMAVLREYTSVRLHTAKQDEPGPSLWIRPREVTRTAEPKLVQAWLPGWVETEPLTVDRIRIEASTAE